MARPLLSFIHCRLRGSRKVEVEHIVKVAGQLVAYLQAHRLILTSAESCTAGTIVSLAADVEGGGALMECGYVVYSRE